MLSTDYGLTVNEYLRYIENYGVPKSAKDKEHFQAYVDKIVRAKILIQEFFDDDEDIVSKRRKWRSEQDVLAYRYNKTGGKYRSLIFYDTDKKRYVKDYRGSASKYIKRLSNKKIRQAEGISNGGNYKKVFDFWWTLW